jgi:hypothetical protein
MRAQIAHQPLEPLPRAIKTVRAEAVAQRTRSSPRGPLTKRGANHADDASAQPSLSPGGLRGLLLAALEISYSLRMRPAHLPRLLSRAEYHT